MTAKFIDIVHEHEKKYPAMQPRDYLKLAYQSEYGPAHTIGDSAYTYLHIKEELLTISGDAAPAGPEDIGDGFVRYPLSLLHGEKDITLLASFVIRTAEEHIGNEEGLSRKISVLLTLDLPGMELELKKWKEKGFPPIHHSKAFCDCYNPHYRLIKKEYISLIEKG